MQPFGERVTLLRSVFLHRPAMVTSPPLAALSEITWMWSYRFQKVRRLRAFRAQAKDVGFETTLVEAATPIVDDIEKKLASSDGPDLFDEKGFWKKGAATWSNTPDGNLEAGEFFSIVPECLRHLPPGQGDAFVPRVMEEMDSEAICSKLEITNSNLWVRLHRVRLRLASCVGSKWSQTADEHDGLTVSHDPLRFFGPRNRAAALFSFAAFLP